MISSPSEAMLKEILFTHIHIPLGEKEEREEPCGGQTLGEDKVDESIIIYKPQQEKQNKNRKKWIFLVDQRKNGCGIKNHIKNHSHPFFGTLRIPSLGNSGIG